MRLLLALLLIPLSGCFGFSVTDDGETPAPELGPPTITARIIVVDTMGQAIPNATVTIPTHNVTFTSGIDANGTNVNLTMEHAIFQASHRNYLDAEVTLPLTNQSGNVVVQLTMDRDIDTWSKAQGELVSMTIDCSVGAAACPASDGYGQATVDINIRVDMIAIAYHEAPEMEVLVELLENGTVVWSTTLDGPGPIGAVALPGLTSNQLRFTATPASYAVNQGVAVQYVVARCVTPPAEWSLVDPTGWDPNVKLPCES